MRRAKQKKNVLKSLLPRKVASKSHSNETVKSILEAAARILENEGLESYTTNLIASRAGVSIGSVYQYFPTKDAITFAVIERESKELLESIASAVQSSILREGIERLVLAAIQYQMRRPTLARVLDFEELRLSAHRPPSANALAAKSLLVIYFGKFLNSRKTSIEMVVGDVMTIIRSLTDRAGESGKLDLKELHQKICAAVFGYLSVFEGAPKI